MTARVDDGESGKADLVLERGRVMSAEGTYSLKPPTWAKVEGIGAPMLRPTAGVSGAAVLLRRREQAQARMEDNITLACSLLGIGNREVRAPTAHQRSGGEYIRKAMEEGDTMGVESPWMN